MTASSQNPSGAQPPIPPYGPASASPEPAHDPRPLQAAYASYAAAIPAPAGPAASASPEVPEHLVLQRPEPLWPMCADCGNRRGLLAQRDEQRYPSGAQVLVCQGGCQPTTPHQAATGVITAAMEQGHTAPAEIADAEEAAGILFDPQRAKAIADAAREQARTEYAAELAQAAHERGAREWFHDRWRAVGRLCEGRPLHYMVKVGEVLAALDGCTPTTAPLTITWGGIVVGPSGDTPDEHTIVPCRTARGGRAALVLDDERRLALGGLLLAVLHTAERCTTPGCGAEGLDDADPSISGWILLDVAGTEGEPRWWCSPLCAQSAMAAAAAELAAADQLAAVDPDQQVPFLLTPEVTTGWETVTAALDERYGPGASDEYAQQQAEAMEAAFEDERGDVDEDGAR